MEDKLARYENRISQPSYAPWPACLILEAVLRISKIEKRLYARNSPILLFLLLGRPAGGVLDAALPAVAAYLSVDMGFYNM